MNTYEQALDMMNAVRRAVRMVGEDIDVVASGYADYRRFDGLNTDNLVNAAADAGCDVVMVDTAIKDGSTLFDALSIDEIQEFIGRGHERGLRVALAGSIKFDHCDVLTKLRPDIIGVRGAVCEGTDRKTKISAEKTDRFVALFHQHSAARQATAN